MSMTDALLDPTGEREAVEKPRLARPTSLDGLTVGVLDISKVLIVWSLALTAVFDQPFEIGLGFGVYGWII